MTERMKHGQRVEVLVDGKWVAGTAQINGGYRAVMFDPGQTEQVNIHAEDVQEWRPLDDAAAWPLKFEVNELLNSLDDYAKSVSGDYGLPLFVFTDEGEHVMRGIVVRWLRAKWPEKFGEGA